MVRKVYSYPGIASGEIQINVGRALVRVPFTKGYLDKKMSRPATYITGDPVMQMIIENSELFNHRIFLKETYGNPEVEETNEEGAEEVAQGTTTYPEVTTWEEAVKILKAVPGVKVTQLRSLQSAKRIAAVNGIVFPNYNFE